MEALFRFLMQNNIELRITKDFLKNGQLRLEFIEDSRYHYCYSIDEKDFELFKCLNMPEFFASILNELEEIKDAN